MVQFGINVSFVFCFGFVKRILRVFHFKVLVVPSRGEGVFFLGSDVSLDNHTYILKSQLCKLHNRATRRCKSSGAARLSKMIPSSSPTDEEQSPLPHRALTLERLKCLLTPIAEAISFLTARDSVRSVRSSRVWNLLTRSTMSTKRNQTREEFRTKATRIWRRNFRICLTLFLPKVHKTVADMHKLRVCRIVDLLPTP